MKIIRSIKEMQRISKNLRESGKSIGFVPTMGYLHEGHLALIKKAREENDILVLSIFVNPLQFGPEEDFHSYPRDERRDSELAKENGVDFLFFPSIQEMYPQPMTTTIKVKERVDVLCGRKRIGHFDGVAMVITKLFHIVQPDRSYFGLKDAQQVAVIEGLIRDYNFPIQLRTVETVREDDGLAKSSRNVYLTEKERRQAKYLYQSLLFGKDLIEKGERNPSVIIEKIKFYLSDRIEGEIDYIELYSFPQLKPINVLKKKVIIALAVQFSKARLIDNVILDIPDGA
ncbi:pantoate--beta-alanine ligase [Fervidibacillus halotolerans]|uniref:Pantothenate synthetase n=1 Tax=Fervidibacillus halotolerans TaxID=2980027 RepID=A0A9E8S015_9BACI|nr:pantoate--beta-alanine ligase [Fervidibacillus halotolerans]WAA13739.1 pantoate--beta-alanine ligase [Fervidibacillus halotolerans]